MLLSFLFYIFPVTSTHAPTPRQPSCRNYFAFDAAAAADRPFPILFPSMMASLFFDILISPGTVVIRFTGDQHPVVVPTHNIIIIILDMFWARVVYDVMSDIIIAQL